MVGRKDDEDDDVGVVTLLVQDRLPGVLGLEVACPGNTSLMVG